MNQAMLHLAALAVAVFGLGGCALGDLDADAVPGPAGLVAAAPAAGKPAVTQLASTIAAPKPTVKARRVTYIVRTAPVLTARTVGSCRWSQGAQARATAYRPAPGMLAPLSARRPVYRFTKY